MYKKVHYCCEDISLIENYEEAKNSEELYDIHHRKEDEGYSRKELIDMGLYYDRPASELIFLSHSEHASHHLKGKKFGKRGPLSQEKKDRISNTLKGREPWNKNKKLSKEHRERIGLGSKGRKWPEETKKKVSEARKGEGNPMYGRKISEETKRKMSEAQKKRFMNKEEREKLSNTLKGREFTEEHKRNLSEASKGEKNGFYGKHHSQETKRKLAEINKKRV